MARFPYIILWLGAAAIGGPVRADDLHLSDAADAVDGSLSLAPAALDFAKQPKAGESRAEPAPKPEPAPATLQFGDPGFSYVALGAGLANNGEDMDENIFASYGYFIARDVEF